MNDLARRIVDRRRELRLEQEEVAERAGLSRAYISRLENAAVPGPKVPDLEKVAGALNLGLWDLLGPGRADNRALARALAEVLPDQADEVAGWVDRLADHSPEVRDALIRLAIRQAEEFAGVLSARRN